jgi:hypothetical protein
MARDYVDIGSTPCEEDCARLGREGYTVQARKECNALINQLRRILGEEPKGARLSIRGNPHDFGTYYEVVCYFENEDETATAYAFKTEANLPMTWDAEARTELGLVTQEG